ncbi:hypothetical protein MNEG_11218 [Monoraphidium neglectum]|uniref:Uncharacterized protein n=1 Tax=Monoraphidium neglectum TaxID=145388 RepID=A0A0D2LZD2_9CHLO|nr:hypothetical protein MNEG_11218 [Monoraphidium neglectum]KIY96744.1 hypothetical protein MNEG_11218 [Monoraphidium neglectum]|eukprot:XP_013895764.1 hypothetical protein MNEG_11218 [Monoraphidium neglectum]
MVAHDTQTPSATSQPRGRSSLNSLDQPAMSPSASAASASSCELALSIPDFCWAPDVDVQEAHVKHAAEGWRRAPGPGGPEQGGYGSAAADATSHSDAESSGTSGPPAMAAASDGAAPHGCCGGRGCDACGQPATVHGVHMPSGGWFRKCRGCGGLTAHERAIGDADVPFCKRCQAAFHAAGPQLRYRMVETLVYVHNAWLEAGL